jgi:hypothetical protein
VTNLDGSALDLDARQVLASNHGLHWAMRETMEGVARGGSAPGRTPHRPITYSSLSATNH